MKGNDDIIVGDLFPRPATGNRVFISIYAEHSIHGDFIVTNEEEEQEMGEVFDLVPEGDALELDINELPPGHYSVKVHIDDKEWIRKIHVGKKLNL